MTPDRGPSLWQLARDWRSSWTWLLPFTLVGLSAPFWLYGVVKMALPALYIADVLSFVALGIAIAGRIYWWRRRRKRNA